MRHAFQITHPKEEGPILLEARHLGRRHPDGQSWLLKDVNLELHAAECLAVVGPSGSGKTLLLRALALLDPLDQGEVCWDGRPIHRDRVPDYRSQVIYVHQRAALPSGTVDAALRQPFALARYRRRSFDPQGIVRRLEQLGRDESFLAKQIRDLSGGESQIVALLRAMQLDPAAMLLDEPTAAMDPATTQAAETLLARWMEEAPGGRALVWVSHDAAQTGRIGRRRIRLESGRVA